MATINLDGFAIVTGAASGIGLATAYAFAEAGVDGVLFADLNAPKAAEVAEESKQYASNKAYRVISTHLDVGDEDSVRAMIALAVREFGTIDHCVNCAGIPPSGRMRSPEAGLDDFDRVHNINARGTFLVDRRVGEVMISQRERTKQTRKGLRNDGRGAIVNIASVAGFMGLAGRASYVSSKHSVLGITKAAGLEFGAQGVRVNAVCPWFTETGMLDPKTSELLDAVSRQNPFGRIAQPEEIASVILFLCSPAANLVNCAEIPIDAGATKEIAVYYFGGSNGRVDFYE